MLICGGATMENNKPIDFKQNIPNANQQKSFRRNKDVISAEDLLKACRNPQAVAAR